MSYRKGIGSTGSGKVGILMIGVAKEGKMWAEGPYLHAFANLARPPFSRITLVSNWLWRIPRRDKRTKSSAYQ